MKLSITMRFVAFALALMVAFGLSLAPALANDTHEDDHAEETATMYAPDPDDTPQMAQMKIILTLLTQIVELLSERADMSDTQSHDDADHESDELAVWVEIHSNKTHAHVQQPGSELDTFFIDEYDYTHEDEIIDAIAERTGLSAHEIENVIVFPSGEVDENGDSVEEGEDSDHDHETSHEKSSDVEGIHIMSDGMIMNGNGDEVHGATITHDGMIMLADGDIVEPEFDLR